MGTLNKKKVFFIQVFGQKKRPTVACFFGNANKKTRIFFSVC